MIRACKLQFTCGYICAYVRLCMYGVDKVMRACKLTMCVDICVYMYVCVEEAPPPEDSEVEKVKCDNYLWIHMYNVHMHVCMCRYGKKKVLCVRKVDKLCVYICIYICVEEHPPPQRSEG